jgi:hypothetical protein
MEAFQVALKMPFLSRLTVGNRFVWGRLATVGNPRAWGTILSRWPCGPPKMMKTQCGAANLGRSRLLAGSGRLKGGCGQDCPPHKAVFDGAPRGSFEE